MFRWCEWGILGVMFPNISESFEWFSLHFRSLFDWLAVADPGEGPGGPARLVFRPKGRPKGRKKFLETGPPLISGSGSLRAFIRSPKKRLASLFEGLGCKPISLLGVSCHNKRDNNFLLIFPILIKNILALTFL